MTLATWWRTFLVLGLCCAARPAAAASSGPLDDPEGREAWLEEMEPSILEADLREDEVSEEPCGAPSNFHLTPVSWAISSPVERPLFGLAPGEAVSSVFGSLRVVELEEQRKTRLLDRLQLRQTTYGGSGDILSGDVVGAAGAAATALSFSLKFGGKKRVTDLLLDHSDPARANWSFGLGLGRLGLKLRSEW